VPAMAGGAAGPDDAVGRGPPISASNDTTVSLPDGTRVVWLRDAGAPPRAGHPTWFRFRVEAGDGKPAGDLAPYMGMAGHAAFVKDDGSVFAHIHPSGSVPMATLSLIEGGNRDPHAGHQMHPAAPSPEIAFPYACPKPGLYRIVVQFKRGSTIETAFFAATVTD
jgi:hypothetical protein